MGERFRSSGLKMRRRTVVLSAQGLVLLLGIQLVGQSPYPQFPSTGGGRNGQNFPDSSSPFGRDSNTPDQKRIKMLNADRQKAIVSETDKLLKLAKELNDEVTESSSGTMTVVQLHKLDEIAKLAKSVKEKMSFSVGGSPSVDGPLTIPPGIQ